MSKQVLSSPFAHNVASVSVPNQPMSQTPTVVQSSVSNKYGAPPPAGSVPASAPPVAQSASAGAFGYNQPPMTHNPIYNPMNSTPAGPAATVTSKYGMPPPVGANPTPNTVSTPLQSQTQLPNNGGTRYAPPAASAPVASTPGYGPPPAVGTPVQQQNPAYGAPPAAGVQPVHQTQATSLSPYEKALKFPSPVELIANSKQEANQFNTAIHPVPPPAASKFITTDQGNCGPRYMRSSLYTIPGTPDIAKKCAIPFGVVVQPLADPVIGESAIAVVDAGPSGPLRCSRCRGYMSSLNKFTNGGRNYSCFLCNHQNDVPDSYFSPLAANGYRMDYLQRPELSRGSVEYVATPEYITKSPFPLSFLFVVEVSAASIKAGVLHSFIASIKAIINSLPSDSPARFGIMTFDSSVHFYNVHSSLSKPQMMVISDLSDMFLPMQAENQLLVRPSESNAFQVLLDELPTYYSGTESTGCAFGAAAALAKSVLETHGGKMILFQATLPNLEPGKLVARLKAEFIGTDKEREFYKSQNPYYTQLAEACVKKKIGVDLFVFADTYLDLATVHCLCKLTGGQLFYYPRFAPQRDRTKFHHELHRLLTRTTGYDGIMRLRVSAGLDLLSFAGNQMLTFGTDMEVANIDCDKTFVVRLTTDGKIPDNTPVGIQCALLYTTSNGQRRIRVHSLQLNSSTQMSNVFGGADLETVTYLLTSQALTSAITTPLADVRRKALDSVVQLVYAFRQYCSTKSFNPQILVIPEGLKLLPLYLICLLKNVMMKNGRVSVDFRVFARASLYNTSVGELTVFLYPRMFALHSLSGMEGTAGPDGTIILPPWQRLLNPTLHANGCYVLDNGRRMFLWIGQQVDPAFLQKVFDATSVQQSLSFSVGEDELCNRVKAIISALQLDHSSYKQLITVKQGGEKELLFVQMMFEERVEETMSHSDVLALVHREVCAKLGKPLN